jgi:hypothetical protein
MLDKFDLAAKLARFREHFSPKIVAGLDEDKIEVGPATEVRGQSLRARSPRRSITEAA